MGQAPFDEPAWQCTSNPLIAALHELPIRFILLTVREMIEAPLPPRFRDSRLIQIGVALFVVGTGPLLAVIAAAELGLTSDPNPNPVGFGIMAMCSFWPSVILVIVGIVKVVRLKRKQGVTH